MTELGPAQYHVPHTITLVEGRQAVWLAGSAFHRQEVAGEFFNEEHVNRVVHASGGRFGVQLIAWLAPEPSNPHDPNAVMIWIQGGRVGYLPRLEAFVWQRPIIDIERRYQQVFKHRRLGANRYGLRVMLEDGVVGWEEKG